MSIWNKVHVKTKHTTIVLHHCRGHELITGAGRNLLRTRAFARRVCYTPVPAGILREERKTTNKHHPSAPERQGIERGAEGELERARRWKEKKTVTGAAHEAWQRLMTQCREGHRRHGYSGLSWWSHTVRSHMCAGAWLHRYSMLIALDKHPLALTSSCVCVCFKLLLH